VFPGREKATYFEHKDANRGRWLSRFQEMMNHGTLRQMPAERALDVIGDLLYGTIFTNYFAGRRKPLAQQVADVTDVLFHGLLTPQQASRRSEGNGDTRTGENAGGSQQ
jgi:hypothetical protein